MDALIALVRTLNAALEHCPPETKNILTNLAQPNISALEAKLSEKPVETPT